jgi:dipeptidase E
MGDYPEHLVALVGGDGRCSVVIANAMDDAPPDVRLASVELELAALADLGLGVAELNLRDYFGHQQRLGRGFHGLAARRQYVHAPLCP